VVRAFASTKTFYKANITWEHYEHNKSGLVAINPISSP
jgi:hypothetical protein